MAAYLSFLLYGVGIAWALAVGLDPMRAGQLAVFAGAIMMVSALLQGRGGALGASLAAYVELAFVASLLWTLPGRSEFAWLCLPSIALAAKVSRRQSVQVGIVSGSMAVTAAFLAMGERGISIPMVASAIGLPIVGMVARPPDKAPEPEDDEARDEELEVAKENAEHAQANERNTRRAYREVVGLYRRLKEKYDEAEASLRLAHAALSEEPAERLLQVAVEIAGAGGGVLWIADPESRHLTVRSCVGGARVTTDRIPLESPEALAGRIKSAGPEMAAKTVSGGTRGQSELLIRDGDRVIGLLTLRRDGRRPLKEGHERLAEHLAGPLTHVRRGEAVMERLEFAETRLRASDLITGSESTEVVAGRALDLMRRVIEAEHWSVWVFGPDGMPQRIVERGRPEPVLDLLRLSGEAFANWVSRDETLHSDDATADTIADRGAAVRRRVRSVLGVPLACGGKAVGAVFAIHSQAAQFSGEARTLALRLSVPIARALELAQIRDRPLAAVRLDPATGLLGYREFAERLRDAMSANGADIAVVRFRCGSDDAEQTEALGRAIASAFATRGFAAVCGPNEFLGCLTRVDRGRATVVANLIAERFRDARIETKIAMAGEDGTSRHELIEATA